MRGLKHVRGKDGFIRGVASFTDAWIETIIRCWNPPKTESHLLQMRGLKPLDIAKLYATRLSHLLQMRGLKPFGLSDSERLHLSHLLQMRGLKLCLLIEVVRTIRRIFYRCVD